MDTPNPSNSTLVFDYDLNRFTYNHTGEVLGSDTFTLINKQTGSTIIYSIEIVDKEIEIEEIQQTVKFGESFIIEKDSNHSVSVQPSHGTLVKNENVFTYSHSGTDDTEDSFSLKEDETEKILSYTVSIDRTATKLDDYYRVSDGCVTFDGDVNVEDGKENSYLNDCANVCNYSESCIGFEIKGCNDSIMTITKLLWRL